MLEVKKVLEKYEKAKENKEVLKSVVKMVFYDEKLESDVAVLDLDGVRGYIQKDEIDYNITPKSMVNYVGRELEFLVVDIKDNEIFCSRSKAQGLKRDEVVERIVNGEELEAEIVNILPFGAYVEVEGVSGLLKNIYFAEDYTSVKEIHKLGDKIKVRLNKISKNDNIIFEAVNKYKSPTIIDIDKLARDQVILGVVRDIKPSGAVFVQIGPNLDALCSLPYSGEVNEDEYVQVRLTKVDPEAGRVRGKILKAIG